MKELLLGCGRTTKKIIHATGQAEFQNVVRLDINLDVDPDVVHDLNILPYPFEDNEFNEIHAYEVMEHVGQQGDWKYFFGQFDELARILKPGGMLYMSFPKHTSVWAWGDPGHTRVLAPEMFQFLDRQWYEDAVDTSAATDYRFAFSSNWRIQHLTEVNPECYGIVLINLTGLEDGNQAETESDSLSGGEEGGQDVHAQEDQKADSEVENQES